MSKAVWASVVVVVVAAGAIMLTSSLPLGCVSAISSQLHGWVDQFVPGVKYVWGKKETKGKDEKGYF